jgi:hypothetical protein
MAGQLSVMYRGARVLVVQATELPATSTRFDVSATRGWSQTGESVATQAERSA